MQLKTQTLKPCHFETFLLPLRHIPHHPRKLPRPVRLAFQNAESLGSKALDLALLRLLIPGLERVPLEGRTIDKLKILDLGLVADDLSSRMVGLVFSGSRLELRPFRSLPEPQVREALRLR
jgi:hypothetical protein